MTELQDLIDLWGKLRGDPFRAYIACVKKPYSSDRSSTTCKVGDRIKKRVQGRATRVAIRLLDIQQGNHMLCARRVS